MEENMQMKNFGFHFLSGYSLVLLISIFSQPKSIKYGNLLDI